MDNKEKEGGNLDEKEKEEEGPDPNEEIIIPVSMKPYIDKELNFQIFIDILTERVDLLRVSLNLQEFYSLNFQNIGLPKVVLQFFAFISNKTFDEIVEKKAK